MTNLSKTGNRVLVQIHLIQSVNVHSWGAIKGGGLEVQDRGGGIVLQQAPEVGRGQANSGGHQSLIYSIVSHQQHVACAVVA